MSNICPFCQKESLVKDSPGGEDSFHVECRRCGQYKITRSAFCTNPNKFGELYILSGIIRNRYESGEKLYLHTRSLENIIETVLIPKDPYDIIDHLLIFIFNKSKKINIPTNFHITYDYPILYLFIIQNFDYLLIIFNSLTWKVMENQ